MSAPGLKITNFHYANMAMPAANPSEYPKWVYPAPMSKNGRMVANAEEEAAYYDAFAKKEPLPAPKAVPVIEVSPTQVLSGPNDEREILLQIAKEKNIKVDARWKTDRIRATIERETANL